MSTVVAIMDRESWQANTDIIVVVEPRARHLLWVPRDVFCGPLHDRINTAFATGGHERLVGALAHLGVHADHSFLVLRSVVQELFADLSITVPVEAEMRWRYPMTPTSRIEDGHKIVSFHPPSETLEGERLHQWIGARFSVPGFEQMGSDLHRIARQQILLRILLGMRASLRLPPITSPTLRLSSRMLLAELDGVRSDWRFSTYGPLANATIDGKMVLVRKDG